MYLGSRDRQNGTLQPFNRHSPNLGPSSGPCRVRRQLSSFGGRPSVTPTPFRVLSSPTPTRRHLTPKSSGTCRGGTLEDVLPLLHRPRWEEMVGASEHPQLGDPLFSEVTPSWVPPDRISTSYPALLRLRNPESVPTHGGGTKNGDVTRGCRVSYGRRKRSVSRGTVTTGFESPPNLHLDRDHTVVPTEKITRGLLRVGPP